MRTKHLWHPATQPSQDKQALLKPELSLSLEFSFLADKEDEPESLLSADKEDEA